MPYEIAQNLLLVSTISLTFIANALLLFYFISTKCYPATRGSSAGAAAAITAAAAVVAAGAQQCHNNKIVCETCDRAKRGYHLGAFTRHTSSYEMVRQIYKNICEVLVNKVVRFV